MSGWMLCLGHDARILELSRLRRQCRGQCILCRVARQELAVGTLCMRERSFQGLRIHLRLYTC